MKNLLFIRPVAALLLAATPILAFAHGISEETASACSTVVTAVCGACQPHADPAATICCSVAWCSSSALLPGSWMCRRPYSPYRPPHHALDSWPPISRSTLELLHLADAIIALSVMCARSDNNGGFQKHFITKSPNLLMAVFGFGLLHDGLSTRLQQLLPDDTLAMLWRIPSFNVGVEIGQIAAPDRDGVAAGLWRHRASFKRLSYAANWCSFLPEAHPLFM